MANAIYLTNIRPKPILRFARVFNAEQIDGIPPLQLTDKSFEWNPDDKGESIL